jgi:hypothetical protein
MLRDHAGLSDAERASLAAKLARLRTLEDVIRWGAAHVPPRLPVEVIGQDEFTNDVVVPIDDGRYLVFDTT